MTPKLRLHGDDFIEGVNLSCDVCKGQIDIQAGYMTCEDACNFDIHTYCYAESTDNVSFAAAGDIVEYFEQEENALLCMGNPGSPIEKR